MIRNQKMYYIGSNEYIITKIKCWPVFKQDPYVALSNIIYDCHASFKAKQEKL